MEKKKEKNKFVQKKDEFMEETKVGQFIGDVSEKEIEEFDTTTTDGFVKQFIVRLQKVDISGLGSQLAFFFLLSLFPLLIFLMTLLPFLNLDHMQIFEFIHDYAPENVAALIETTLKEVLETRSGGLLSIGAIATIWSASKGMNALTKALNRSYFVEKEPNFLITRLTAVLLTILLIGVVVVVLAFPIFGEFLGSIVFSFIGAEAPFIALWEQIRWTVPPILIFAVFTLIYWLIPNQKIPFVTVLPGAILATIGWIATSYFFSYYISNYGNYSSTYGSIGAIIILMMWLYISAMILIICGQVNAVVFDRHRLRQMKEQSNE